MIRKCMGNINTKVFLLPAILLAAGSLLGVVFPDAFNASAAAMFHVMLEKFAWVYVLAIFALLVFCIWAGFSRYGDIRLGGETAAPEMSFKRWLIVSLTSGMAYGVTFYGVAEPMMNYLTPAKFTGLTGGSAEAAEGALYLAFFHWALHPYALYTAASLGVAFLFWNGKKKFRVSTSLYPMFGEKINGSLGDLVDGLVIFAMIAGVAVSLGMGMLQISAAMSYLWGIESTAVIWLIIITLITIISVIAACTGMSKGIKYACDIKMYSYIILLVWVLIFGGTAFIFNNTISSIGDYLRTLIPQTFYLEPVVESGWVHANTMFYWAWWFAFAPIIGLFLVKLAKGRTIRQFVLVNLLAPAVFIVIWFGAFGSSSIRLEHFFDSGIGTDIENFGAEVSLFSFLDRLPAGGIMALIAFVAVAISIIVLSNSTTLTIAEMTAKEAPEGEEAKVPAGLKIFWGSITAAIAFIMLQSGGLKSLQMIVTICGLPIAVLMCLMAVSYIKGMLHRKEYDKTIGEDQEENHE